MVTAVCTPASATSTTAAGASPNKRATAVEQNDDKHTGAATAAAAAAKGSVSASAGASGGRRQQVWVVARGVALVVVGGSAAETETHAARGGGAPLLWSGTGKRALVRGRQPSGESCCQQVMPLRCQPPTQKAPVGGEHDFSQQHRQQSIHFMVLSGTDVFIGSKAQRNSVDDLLMTPERDPFLECRPAKKRASCTAASVSPRVSSRPGRRAPSQRKPHECHRTRGAPSRAATEGAADHVGGHAVNMTPLDAVGLRWPLHLLPLSDGGSPWVAARRGTTAVGCWEWRRGRPLATLPLHFPSLYALCYSVPATSFF